MVGTIFSVYILTLKFVICVDAAKCTTGAKHMDPKCGAPFVHIMTKTIRSNDGIVESVTNFQVDKKINTWDHDLRFLVLTHLAFADATSRYCLIFVPDTYLILTERLICMVL